ncbi:MAG: hypothetical protein QHH12_04260 [Candidatus Bathyarchaeota archaeon]|jgi:hypothetical protein|nr:hypothetical protein [Candidatus Bathyarchaeota archaeon A05DMB-3]MDH7606965.1 hypothetical protein [Candidatus Bathyarchaeota archaeon]
MAEEKEKRKKEEVEDVEELREVLSVVSKEVPALIKGIIASIFSEEAGRDMGRAAAAFYKELKEAGMPEDVAVKMTEGYISAFTSLGEVMKKAVSGEKGIKSKELEEEISRRIKEKLAEKGLAGKEEEEEEDEDDED